MVSNEEPRDIHLPLLMLLCAGALMLMGGAVYLVQIFSVLYGAGLGAGAVVQGLPASISVSQGLQEFISQADSLHRSVLESYVLLIISILMYAAAFLMFLRYYDRGISATVKKYALPYIGSVVVYALLVYVEVSPFYTYFQSAYMYVLYAGIAVSLLSSLYLEYLNRMPAPKATKMKHAMNMDPTRPYSNIADLQDQIFSRMSGHLRIVDKHFNSAALSNFHRLIDQSITNFTKITILTSREMLDSDFNSNLTDFKNELNQAGISLEVRLLDDKDSADQHERILMSDSIAYKIPPFNIINKKSEHITTINLNDAMRRFTYIYGRAIKVENYMVQKDRNQQAPQAQNPA